MAAKLQKLPGRPAELGMYRLSGDLAGLDGPGRRVVRDLEAIRVHGPPDALTVLEQFVDLRRLGLGGIAGLRLEPLGGLGLQRLAISGGRELDLEPLSACAGLEHLLLSGLEQCRVPERLVLPRTLRSLVLINDTVGGTPTVVEALLRSIEWSALEDLQGLDVRSGGAHAVAPVRADLAFLRALPNLERLEMSSGVLHAGPGPSPLEPPFDGLSRKLSWLRIEGDDPEVLQAQLQSYLPSTYPVVYPRPRYDDDGPIADEGEWQLIEPDPDDPESVWQTYGSLADAFIDDDFAVEYDACEAAQKRLRSADAARAARIEFDQEAAGTGIYAHAREDLEWALATLGLVGSPS
jgi:hypothetical protein